MYELFIILSIFKFLHTLGLVYIYTYIYIYIYIYKSVYKQRILHGRAEI